MLDSINIMLRAALKHLINNTAFQNSYDDTVVLSWLKRKVAELDALDKKKRK